MIEVLRIPLGKLSMSRPAIQLRRVGTMLSLILEKSIEMRPFSFLSPCSGAGVLDAGIVEDKQKLQQKLRDERPICVGHGSPCPGRIHGSVVERSQMTCHGRIFVVYLSAGHVDCEGIDAQHQHE